jgi:hypothetical protein
MMLFAIVLITIGHSKSKKIAIARGQAPHYCHILFTGIVVVVMAIIQSKRALFGISH